MLEIVLLTLIILSGYILKLEKNKRMDIVKALFIIVGEVFICFLMFIVLMFVFSLPIIRSYTFKEINSLFILILIIAIINGFICYWINRYIFFKLKINSTVQTLCEYIIQWSLIYFTIYQVIFDEITSKIKGFDEVIQKAMTIDVTKPSELFMVVLPSLISIWIGIIVYKHSNGDL